MSSECRTEFNDTINNRQLSIGQNTLVMSCITVYIQNKQEFINNSVDKYSSRVKYNEGFVRKPNRK